MMFREQAEQCRRQANEFVGRPEAPFLLRVASVFDELAIETDSHLITSARPHQPAAIRAQ